MTPYRLLSFILIATLASGCAMHTPPAPMDARPVGTDDKVGAVAANLWYVPSRVVLCGVGASISAVVMTVTLDKATIRPLRSCMAGAAARGFCSRATFGKPSRSRGSAGQISCPSLVLLEFFAMSCLATS